MADRVADELEHARLREELARAQAKLDGEESRWRGERRLMIQQKQQGQIASGVLGVGGLVAATVLMRLPTEATVVCWTVGLTAIFAAQFGKAEMPDESGVLAARAERNRVQKRLAEVMARLEPANP